MAACREGMATVRVEGLELEALCELSPGSRAKVLIHPEEVVLLADAGDAGSARNRLPARVKEVHVMGALVKDMTSVSPLTQYHIARQSADVLIPSISPG